MVIKPAMKKSREMERKYGKKRGVGRSRGKFKLPTKEQYRLVGERLGILGDVSDREYDKFMSERANGSNS